LDSAEHGEDEDDLSQTKLEAIESEEIDGLRLRPLYLFFSILANMKQRCPVKVGNRFSNPHFSRAYFASLCCVNIADAKLGARG